MCTDYISSCDVGAEGSAPGKASDSLSLGDMSPGERQITQMVKPVSYEGEKANVSRLKWQIGACGGVGLAIDLWVRLGDPDTTSKLRDSGQGIQALPMVEDAKLQTMEFSKHLES